MIFGGVLKLNNNLVAFIIVLGFLLAVGCSRFLKMNMKVWQMKTLFIFKKDSYEHNVYNTNEKEDGLSSDYFKNLNPYSDNVMMPTSSISENKPNVNNRPVSIPSNDEFNMNNNIGNPGLNNVSGMANMSGSINGNANGILGRDIPAGQEDLYVLKSQIVPPVCPACPVIREQKKCAPCPPCGRCPEEKFSCKKVPNYKSMDPRDYRIS